MYQCCINTYTYATPSYGIAATQVVTARPRYAEDHCTAGACTAATGMSVEFDEYNRAIVGVININPTFHEFTSASKAASALSILLHEITHALGLSSNGFDRMVDEELNPRWGTVATIKNQPQLGVLATNRYLQTPRVVQAVRRQFSCDSLRGAAIEDDGSSGSAGSHWEMRLFRDEFMSASPENAQITELSLAFLEDSGHFRVNFSNVNVSPWGFHLGCTFSSGDCAKWGGISNISPTYSLKPKASNVHTVCSPSFMGRSNNKVTTSASGYTYKPNDEFGDGCPTATNQFPCSNLQQSQLASRYYPDQSNGADARCFKSDALKSGYSSGFYAGRCFKTKCDASRLLITIEGKSFACPAAGGTITISGYAQGGVLCPPFALMCGREAKLAASQKQLRSIRSISVRSLAPNGAGLGGGTHVRIYGQGFAGGAVAVAFGRVTVPSGDVTVASNLVLLVTIPRASTAGAVNVTVRRTGSSTDMDTGLRAFTYSASLPSGDAKDHLPSAAKCTRSSPCAGSFSNVSSQRAEYRVIRGGDGSRAGSPAGFVVCFTPDLGAYKSNYGVLKVRLRDGNVPTKRHHDATLPSTSTSLFGSTRCLTHALGVAAGGVCGAGDGNAYISVENVLPAHMTSYFPVYFTLTAFDDSNIATLSPAASSLTYRIPAPVMNNRGTFLCSGYFKVSSCGTLSKLRVQSRHSIGEWVAITVRRGRFPASAADGTRLPSSSYRSYVQEIDFRAYSGAGNELYVLVSGYRRVS